MIYLQLLKLKFDCIYLSEVWSYNLDLYKNIFNDCVSFFKPPEGSNIGGVGIFIKKDYKISAKIELKLSPSDRLKVEDLWLGLTNSCNEKFIVGVIYRHSKGSISDFTTSIENSVSKIINDKAIKASAITGDFLISLIQCYKIHFSPQVYFPQG